MGSDSDTAAASVVADDDEGADEGATAPLLPAHPEISRATPTSPIRARQPARYARAVTAASVNEQLTRDVAVGGIQLEAFGVFLVAVGILLQGIDLAVSPD